MSRHSSVKDYLSAILNLIQLSDVASEENIMQYALDQSERLSGSSISYFHLVNQDQKTIRLCKWSTATMRNCHVESKETHYPIEKAGVWVDCIRMRRAVIHNDYQNLSHKKGLPEGHVSVVREMAVPVFESDKVVAILGVGNKPADYEQFDVDTITIFARTAWHLIQKKRLDNELEKYQLHLEELVQERSEEMRLEIEKRKKSEEQLKTSEKHFRLALDAASDGVWDRNLRTREVYFGQNWAKMFGYTTEEVRSGKITWQSLIHPDDKQKALGAVRNHLKGNTSRYVSEYRIRNKFGDWQWVLSRGKIVEWDEKGRPLRFIGTHTDITYLKSIERDLKNAQTALEQKIKDRTRELEDTNIALKVLIGKRGEAKRNLEKQIMSNVSELVDPYLGKLKKISPVREQQVLLGILESNIKEITSSFSGNIALDFARLTPTEVQVVNLVKQGKKTKDIADVLCLSPGTISVHRRNIRKKLGLSNQNVNLQSFLSSRG